MTKNLKAVLIAYLQSKLIKLQLGVSKTDFVSPSVCLSLRGLETEFVKKNNLRSYPRTTYNDA